MQGMNSTVAHRALYGIFCVYKPPEKPMFQITKLIKQKILDDLNRMPGRPLKQRVVYHEENLGTNLPVATTVPDLADHPLVVGNRFLDEDISIGQADRPHSFLSGVTVLNVNGSFAKMTQLRNSGHMKVYHAKAEMGYGTFNFMPTGKIMQRTTYHHVSLEKLDRVLAGIQSSHQRHMYELSGVDLQTQEAYELAVKGLVRPKAGSKTCPMIYGIKCIDFSPPYFTLEIHCVNENSSYLMKLLHEIGLELRTTAVCKQLRRIRFGHFTLSHALLHRQWTLEEILKNIQDCKGLVTKQMLLSDGNIEEVERLDYNRTGSNSKYLGSGGEEDRLLLTGAMNKR